MIRTCLTAVSVALVQPSALPSQQAVVFRDVTVIPMDSNRVLPHHSVIVRGDRIVSIAPADQFVVPDAARVVEGTGKFLIPGLADMHVHLPGDTSNTPLDNALTLFVSQGVTTIRVMGGNQRHLIVRDSVRSGSRFGPTMFVAGATVGGLSGNTNDLRRVLTGREAAQLAAQVKQAGFDFIQIGETMLRPEYEGLSSAARRAGIPVTGGVPADVGLQRVLRDRQATIENLEGYVEYLERDDSPIRLADPLTRARRLPEYYDPAKITRLARDLKAAGTANTPTLFINHLGVTQQPAETLAAWPEMKYISPRTVAAWTRQVRRAQEQAADPVRTSRYLDYRNVLTTGLNDAGALILAGSDAWGAFLVPGFSTVYEIHSLNVAGLTTYDALRAATVNAGEFMRATDRFGSITAGSRADLVLLDANPLDNIAALTLRAGVMLRGRWYTAVELDEMLAEIARLYAPSP